MVSLAGELVVPCYISIGISRSTGEQDKLLWTTAGIADSFYEPPTVANVPNMNLRYRQATKTAYSGY